jgi:hypothetical protein
MLIFSSNDTYLILTIEERVDDGITALNLSGFINQV